MATSSNERPEAGGNGFVQRKRFTVGSVFKLTQSLAILAIMICLSGCQIGGSFDGNRQISLAPTPAPQPVRTPNASFNATANASPKVGLVSSRPTTALNKKSVSTNSIIRTAASKQSSIANTHSKPLINRINRINRSRSKSGLEGLSNVKLNETSVIETKTAEEASSSILVAFQEDAANPTEAAKIPSGMTLPFENSTDLESGTDNGNVTDDQEAEDEFLNQNDSQYNSQNDDQNELSYERDRQNGSTDDSIELTNDANSLTLVQVITSVKECYPEIEIAIGDIEEARGKVLSSWGEFDSTFDAYSIAKPLSFYEQYRNGTGVTRQLYGGGEVYGQYRSGRGTFEPWYGERETDQAGEFKVGFTRPLLKDRDIDKRRASLIAAGFARDQVEANVETRLLQFERFATQAYWDWVASGQAVVIQQQLLRLAERRVEQISLRIEQGDLAKIAEIDNDRFIAKRRNSLIKARRGLEKAAIKLSLFYRDGECLPVIVNEQRLPIRFPQSNGIDQQMVQGDIGLALQNRPELVELAAARREACIKLQYANNLLLPKLDVKGFAAKDIGNLTSSRGDKRPFELEIGVFAEVPIQRREGAGKIQSAQGKITQIDAKRRLVSDKIRAEIQDAASAVNASFDQIRQSRENVRLNEQSLELGRLAFEEGDIDLLALNIYESSVADAKLQLLEAEYKYFYSLAIYQTITQSEAFVDR